MTRLKLVTFSILASLIQLHSLLKVHANNSIMINATIAVVRFCTLFVFLLIAVSFESLAQTSTEQKAVTATINQLFQGMEKGDSAMVRTSFAPQVTMATIRRDKDNKPQIDRESSIDGFLKVVGTPHTETWYEEIWNLKISIDGDFAQAWCDYAFYRDNKFNHCGVDAFQLYHGDKGWKIFHLADTRRNTGCEIPSEIQRKHNTK